MITSRMGKRKTVVVLGSSHLVLMSRLIRKIIWCIPPEREGYGYTPPQASGHYFTEENLKQQVLDCKTINVFSNTVVIQKSHLELEPEEIEVRIAWNKRRWNLVKIGARLPVFAHNLTGSPVVATERRSKRHYLT